MQTGGYAKVVSVNLHYIRDITRSTRQENSRVTILFSILSGRDKLV